MRKYLLFILLLLILSGSCSSALEVSRISNGVEIVTQNLESDIIALDVWVRVGSRNETPQINGISHFIEHLLFKGSEKFKGGEMDRMVEESGGIFNAATSKDFTHFYIVIPKQYFKKAAEIMGDTLTNPLFPEDEVEKERKVILEEIYRSKSQYQRELTNLLYAKSFRNHPYRYPVLGTYASVSYLSRDTIKSFYRVYYTGKNVHVIAAGGLPRDAVSILKKEFKNIPRLSGKFTPPKAERLSENRLFEMKKKVAAAYLDIAFSSPAASTFDSYVMDVAVTILGNGRNSRLNKEVKENSGLVHGIDIGYPTPIDPNLVIIDVDCDPAKVDQATKKIFGEINRLKTEPVSNYELTKAKTLLDVDQKITYASPQSLASELGYFTTVADVDYEKNYMKNINKVTAADIQRVAREYFEYYTIARFIPE